MTTRITSEQRRLLDEDRKRQEEKVARQERDAELARVRTPPPPEGLTVDFARPRLRGERTLFTGERAPEPGQAPTVQLAKPRLRGERTLFTGEKAPEPGEVPERKVDVEEQARQEFIQAGDIISSLYPDTGPIIGPEAPFVGPPSPFPEIPEAELLGQAQETIANLQRKIEEDPDAFLEDLWQKGRNADTEFVLDFFGWSERDIAFFFQGAPDGAPTATEATLRRVYPGQDVDAILDWAIADEEAFQEDLKERGATQDTILLLRQEFPDSTDEEILAFFEERPTIPFAEFLGGIETGFQYAT
ncbi:hypothetical protein LCGC14_2823740, partial [marine sediment metagenome]